MPGFQSTRPIRGATFCACAGCTAGSGFQSTRPIRGATQPCKTMWRSGTSFQSTRPIRGATIAACETGDWKLFQSTRPIRGATLLIFVGVPDIMIAISIHAPHTGRDKWNIGPLERAKTFQSTRPIRGATVRRYRLGSVSAVFQSTRPIRGATQYGDDGLQEYIFQSTRPIRGATANRRMCSCLTANFNPRAPYGARPGALSPSGRR